VIIFLLLLAHETNLDVKKIINSKIQKNKKHYPIKKSKGSSKKYTET